MGLITKEVEVTLHSKTTKHYEDLGYEIPRVKGKWGITVPHGTTIKVKVEDLTHGSAVRVDVECECCHKINNIKWIDFKTVEKENGEYYCLKCAINKYAINNAIKTTLKKTKSFEQWCIENNKQDVLDRWDYKLNKNNPNEITYMSGRKYWFKCPLGIHDSELKNIQPFVSSELENSKSLDCNACNSFAQWGIDNICENFLEMYWDYEKNIDINPWIIACHSNKKVWIKCQEKDYHGSYDIKCNDFVSANARCPFCSKNSGKVHPKDSLGALLEEKGLLHLWSDKNKKSPYEYSPKTSQKLVWWKCLDNKHKDYLRDIASSNTCGFRCPECGFSFGENRISDFLITNNIKYEPQQTFNKLVGLGGFPLSYDFYIPNYGLVEYQGQFHDGIGSDYIKRNLKTQQEHDKRKREYAHNHNINLLEIWYWDFDNIEQILEKELSHLINISA